MKLSHKPNMKYTKVNEKMDINSQNSYYTKPF